jgi:hypothetical protein
MAQDALFYRGATRLTDLVPLEVGPLNADDDEVSEWIELVVKAPANLESASDLVFGPTGASAAKWQLAAWTSGDTTGPQATPEAYGSPLTIPGSAGQIDDTTGVRFWVRAKATSGESASNDTSVSFVVTAGTWAAV